jgi:peptidoglycan/LPS O-acetylase OafA/YrhL
MTRRSIALAISVGAAAAASAGQPAVTSAAQPATKSMLGSSDADDPKGSISPECLGELLYIQSQGTSSPDGKLPALLRLGVGTGTALPNDAGKFEVCDDADDTRYFMVTMLADINSKSVKQSLPINLGICLPDACDKKDVLGVVTSKYIRPVIPALGYLSPHNITATSPKLDVQQMGVGGAIAVAIVSFLAFLVVCATSTPMCSDRWYGRGGGALERESSPGGSQVGDSLGGRMRSSPEPIQEPDPEGSVSRGTSLHALPLLDNTPGTPTPVRAPTSRPSRTPRPTPFSAFSMTGESGTIKKLLEIPAYKPTDSLNGLRVISMAWIILGHTFLMPQGISGYSNPESFFLSELQTKNVAEGSGIFMFVLSAQISVDTFFFLSGFLLSLLTLQELRARRGKASLLAAIVLRYIRLTPSLALTMLVYYKIWPYLATGPFAPKFQDSIFRRCDASWWSELTYTLNFIPFDSDSVCMGWTWYLGDDMIFFIVGIIVLPLYYRRKFLGWFTIALLSGASFALTMWLVVKYHLGIYIFDDHYKDYSYYAYSKPYTRIPAYFVGMCAAWFLDDLERVHFITRPLQAPEKYKMAASLLALLSFVTLVFIIVIPVTDFGANKNSWSDWMSAIYLTFSRPLWAACWAVITLLCYYDLIPLVNNFLAHPWWTPLARLTYGAYLVHPMVIKLAAGRSMGFYNFSTMDLLYRWVGNCIMAYAGSGILWVLVERPAMTMTSMLLKRKPPQAESKPPATGSNAA